MSASSRRHNLSRWPVCRLVPLTNVITKCVLVGERSMCHGERFIKVRDQRHVTIDTLLDVFDLYRGDDEYFTIRMWKSLVHVCRRWRSIIFASPRRLHLVLDYYAGTSLSKLLDTCQWPPLPITIRCSLKEDVEWKNIIAALELRDRISGINLDRRQDSDELERFMFMMQQPFPALRRFRFAFHYDVVALITFLAGSSWQLQSFNSHKITFLEFPKFFSSATCLTSLSLLGLPRAQHYFSPEMIVTYLAMLPILEEFSVGFCLQAHESRPDPSPSTNPPSQTRVVLPALTSFRFEGVSEYLEDFVSRINTPQLDNVHIVFLIHNIFHVQQLCELIVRSETVKPFEQAFVDLHSWTVRITLGSPTCPSSFFLGIKCYTALWRISLMAQLCNDLLPLLSHVERLEVGGSPCPASPLLGDMDIESAQWLKLFRPFTAVQSLHVSNLIVPLVAPVLQGPNVSGKGHTDVLPALRELIL